MLPHPVAADVRGRTSPQFNFRRLTSAATILLAASLTTLLSYAADRTVGFEFHDGDRVVLIGDTLIERETEYGHIEERLTTQLPDRNVTFRNLGWSADTPAGESRASFDFDKPGKGFEKIKEELSALQPTVLVVGYGMASSFAGEPGLSTFRQSLNKL